MKLGRLICCKTIFSPSFALKRSFHPGLNTSRLLSLSESEGKSGSFFFFTHDNKFLIKTISDEEVEKLNEMAEQFASHITEIEESLLSRIYGIYTVVVDVSKVNVVIMQNLNQFPKSCIKRVFDLKGSKVNRFTKNIRSASPLQALKDLDFLWMINTNPYVVR